MQKLIEYGDTILSIIQVAVLVTAILGIISQLLFEWPFSAPGYWDCLPFIILLIGGGLIRQFIFWLGNIAAIVSGFYLLFIIGAGISAIFNPTTKWVGAGVNIFYAVLIWFLYIGAGLVVGIIGAGFAAIAGGKDAWFARELDKNWKKREARQASKMEKLEERRKREAAAALEKAEEETRAKRIKDERDAQFEAEIEKNKQDAAEQARKLWNLD
ncbi:MAG: hypothetical protein KDD04_09150 [Sinomicrobium sp.]|nr:hypothetical protein [Sinomicrobium sp.]